MFIALLFIFLILIAIEYKYTNLVNIYFSIFKRKFLQNSHTHNNELNAV